MRDAATKRCVRVITTWSRTAATARGPVSRSGAQVQHRDTLVPMPTTRPRHTITETPPIQAALDALRARLGVGERIDFAELVMLGAEVKARRMATEDAAAATARRRLAEMIRTGSFRYAVDVEAADEVKRLGLIVTYDS